MEKLIIGIDLCDTYTQAAVLGREETWVLPTVICRKKTIEEWCIGEEAYKYTLVGEGVIVDKLLSLALKNGTSTIVSTKYDGIWLLSKYLEKLLDMIRAEYPGVPVAQLVISLKNMEMKLMDQLMGCADYLQIPRDNVHIASHTECFVYYVLSQRRDVWGGQVGMFALSDEDLRYYELKVTRGPRQVTALAEHEELEEGFSLNVLDSTSGARMADKILCACADRLLQKKLFSSVFLTGKGFAKTDWAPDFMKKVCHRRRVFVEPTLFARGAALKAEDYLHERTSYPFVCICEGKLKSTVTMEVVKRDTKVQMALAVAGESWYEARSVLEVILDNQDDIELTIIPHQDPKQKRIVKIPLEGFPKRPNKTTRVRIAAGFLDEKTMVIKIVDRGFGELFPKTDAEIRQEVLV
ncbi:MAG: hypothetical protein IJ374_04105 [Lachnospiraceae bacterium]|nr:hypothetical protein [Lachnospiraceae bacterium]